MRKVVIGLINVKIRLLFHNNYDSLNKMDTNVKSDRYRWFYSTVPNQEFYMLPHVSVDLKESRDTALLPFAEYTHDSLMFLLLARFRQSLYHLSESKVTIVSNPHMFLKPRLKRRSYSSLEPLLFNSRERNTSLDKLFIKCRSNRIYTFKITRQT